VKRTFRNAVYHITVQNPDHLNKGVKSLYVDGKEITGQLIPAFQDGQEHQVEVILGLK